ncbi:MAG TPA: SRPBCC domain-containing protein [Devosia sp.]|nr:SRPBCC domain-containing protein [Devosia sp.]
MDDLLVRRITLDCPVDHAFEVFTRKIDLWWPRGHRRNREGRLHLEAREGGSLVELSPEGGQWTMGRVTAIEPPERLELDWYPGSPAAPTRVEVRFVATPAGTEIIVTHRPLPDSRSIWPERVGLFAGGWEAALPAFKTFLGEHLR